MGRCSGRILLALAGLLCLMSHGFGALIPQDISDQSAPPPVTIDQIIAKAEKDDADKNGEFYFSENTHLIRRELDMVYTLDQWMDLQHGRKKRTSAVRDNGFRWTNNIVNYEIESGSFTYGDMNVFNRAFREIEHYTCLTMRETSTARNRVFVSQGSGGCYSYVGMLGDKYTDHRVQTLGLSSGCRINRIVVHEFLHAIGIHHEQTRPDRDDHVTIRLENIQDNVEYNFDKYNWNYINNFSLPYDYASVMHYGPTAFSTNGQRTIETRDPYYQNKIGNNQGLSMGDIRTLNSMYNCVPASCTLTENDCKRQGGWVGKDCKCWCPGPNEFRSPVEYCSAEHGVLDFCEDAHPDCTRWRNDGYCEKKISNVNYKYMMDHCPRTCNSC